ncbi:MAG: hypothetical protein J5809_08210 [Selenomonadaceae bacterium]|nr:hypothetical protein [Selenomonadaceae bacterium]
MRKVCFVSAALIGISLFHTQNVTSADSSVALIPAYIQTAQIEPLPNWNWWANETLTVEGHGFAHDGKKNTPSEKLFARRMAMMDGYRNLAEAAGKVQITSKETLEIQKVNALIKGANVLSETYDERGNCTVILSVPIYGVTGSFAEAAFSPVAREDFLTPTSDVLIEGEYTGLIIDCGDLELKPVLSPVIRNELNHSIYAFSNLDYDKVIAQGMIGYAEKNLPDFGGEDDFIILTSAGTQSLRVANRQDADGNLSRAGNNPLVINAALLSDDGTCPVISTEDADKILAENLVTHFLEEGAVVFTSNRIRGMRM